MQTFGILGYGFVGKATHMGLLNNCPVSIFDLLLDTTINDLRDSTCVFVCIPTSTMNDIAKMIDVLVALKQINQSCLIVIRSTVPIGVSRKIQQEIADKIIYMPEFLRERFWNVDCFKRPIIVAHDDDLQLPTWLTSQDIIKCSLEEAEILKMFSNNYAAIRIAFANVFYDLSQSMGADYDTVKNMFFKIQHDQTYMEVPGHDGTRGFGGKCLPKDLDFLIDTLDAHNIDQNWFKHIRELNKQWKEKF